MAYDQALQLIESSIRYYEETLPEDKHLPSVFDD